MINDWSNCILFWLGFPFAKLLRNFCGTKRKIFLSLRISFVRKKQQFARKQQQFAQSFVKVILRKIALFCFCETQVLRNSSTQFRKNQTVGNGMCFLEFISGKIFVLECFPIGHFYIIDQWQLRRVQLSQFSRQF